jgi:hypothetical protein
MPRPALTAGLFVWDLWRSQGCGEGVPGSVGEGVGVGVVGAVGELPLEPDPEPLPLGCVPLPDVPPNGLLVAPAGCPIVPAFPPPIICWSESGL